eukprot:COSAG06_NODE_440_length_15762_cov_75.979825_9_plen_455_part_00
MGSGSDDTDAGTAVAIAWPLAGARRLADALQVPIIELLVAGFTTANDNTPFFRIEYEQKGTTHVIVTDVPISLDDIHVGKIGDHLRAVAMIDTEQQGDIAHLTTSEGYRGRGFGKACVYAAIDYSRKDKWKIYSKPNTIDFWKDQCGFVKPSEEDSDSGSDSGSDSAAEARGDAAAAAKPVKCMKASIPSVTMEGNVDDVWEKLRGKKMAGYAYIFKPKKNWIMPVEIPGRVEIPRPLVLKRPASAAAAAADSASGSVVKKPRKEPKNTELHKDMLAAKGGASGIAASGAAGAHGQDAGMADGQPTATAASHDTAATGSNDLVAFDTGGRFKGSQCEECETAFPIDTSAKKKTKSSAREFYLFKKLQPTGNEIRTMAKQSNMHGICVLKGWKPNLQAKDATELDSTMKTLSERLGGFTGVPSTWTEYKKYSRNYGALCQNCWEKECTEKNLTPS